jgi:hypothetical protein
MILDYIRQNSLDNDPKITKSDIMKQMKDSRMMTTHKTTTELINEGKIKLVKPKDKPDSKIDYLVINEENEFNKIYNSLAEIELLVNKMHDNVKNSRREFVEQKSSWEEFMANMVAIAGSPIYDKWPEIEKLHSNFTMAYYDAINLILHRLLYTINNEIHSEKDSQILYTKILDLLNKLTLQFSDLNPANELNDILNNRLRTVESSPYIQSLGINLNVVNDVIDVIERYKNQFLIDRSSEHKTKKSHQNL